MYIYIYIHIYSVYTIYTFSNKKFTDTKNLAIIYLNVPGIPVRKPFENRQIVEEQLDV